MNNLRLYLTLILTFFFSLSGINGNIVEDTSVAVSDVMFAAYDHQAYENDADDYDTFDSDEGNIFTSYNFTNAKRHMRSNERRKVHSGQGGLFNGDYSILNPTYNDFFQRINSVSPGCIRKDYVVLLRKLII